MDRIKRLILTFVLWVLVFALQKPVFMAYYHKLYADASVSDWLSVIWHGLPLDLSLAGYLSAIPALLLIISVWTVASWLRKSARFYFMIMALLVAVIFVVDLGLYDFWGFRLDATPVFYFLSSPANSLASVGWLFKGVALLTMLFLAFFIFLVFRLWVLHPALKPINERKKSWIITGVLVVLAALLFIPIRGGFSEATMNTGHVFYSQNMALNHAAINPVFNLMESLGKEGDFANQYRFMSDVEADEAFSELVDPQVALNEHPDSLVQIIMQESSDSLHNLFTTKCPEVLFLILESFSSKLMQTLGGEAGVAVNLDSLSHESIFFKHFYANSFRTDRGLVSILSGYPAQPAMSMMKYPRKTQNLPSIAGTLRVAGYDLSYYYGGDANFTNMRSYLRASGFGTIVSEDDFTASERQSKWGVHDEVLFQRLLQDLQEEAKAYKEGQKPHFRVLQTSSSHEPFEVPFHKLDNPRLNAFAYTDSCVGKFISEFKKLPQWKNTILVIVPDHLGAYPEHIDNLTAERYQIPLLIIGGAIRQPMEVETIGTQHDIAATLLAQMELPHSDFLFSKDMFNPTAPHFAFFTVPDAMGMVTEENCWIYDNKSRKVVVDEGVLPGKNARAAKAYLQKLYDDIASK